MPVSIELNFGWEKKTKPIQKKLQTMETKPASGQRRGGKRGFHPYTHLALISEERGGKALIRLILNSSQIKVRRGVGC